MEHLLIPLEDDKQLAEGTIIRRVGNGKDQQGCFAYRDEEDNLILINVIDLNEGSLITSEGILKPGEGDSLFIYKSTFRSSNYAAQALEIVKGWSLFLKNEALQESIIKFVKITFVPEQIITCKDEDSLAKIFIPVQQKFRIGRFKERRNWDRVCRDNFRSWLDSLQPGEHITYLAQIMQQKAYTPKFYTLGTRPHQITESHLMNEPFNFKPTHGGHIKAVTPDGGEKQYLVDAGSNYIGRGVNAPLFAGKQVSEALKKLYPHHTYVALPGRGAFGTGQSY